MTALVLLIALVPIYKAYAGTPLKAQERQNLKRLNHSTQVIRFFERHPKIVNKHGTKAWRIIHYHQRVIRRSTARLLKVRAQLLRPPHYRQWLCIHHYEGSWTDPNAPYYGGLQMDYSFMRAHGPELLRRKGTADNWTPLEQMWVAERAWRTRGFYPWPNTARWCGLL